MATYTYVYNALSGEFDLVNASSTTYTASTGITLTDTAFSTNDSEIVHNNLSGYTTNAHIDWTTDQGATNIDVGNYTNTTYTASTGITLTGTAFSTIDWTNSTNNFHTTGSLSSSGANFRGCTVVGAVDYNPSALTDDYIIAMSDTAAPRAVTISSEDVATGTATIPRIFVIKDQSGASGSNNITVTLESGGTIDGEANFIMNVNYQSITLYVDGTNAHIL